MNASRLLPAALFLLLSLSGCALREARPDLARLYERESARPDPPPVILIHGLMGSTLVHADSGEEFWPGSLGAMAFGNYRELSSMSAADREGQGLVPGDLFYGIAGVDFYSQLLATLETAGRFRRGTPGMPVPAGERRRYYVLLYDWRRDNIEAVRRLHALIEQVRVDHGDPTLRVDVIAHSNGGLVANYYLRYGPSDLPGPGEAFVPWDEGDRRIRRLVLLGTPSLGAVTSLERLLRGFRLALRTVPVEVMATFATPFQALPHPLAQVIVDAEGRSVPVNLHDPETYRRWRWSVYAPDVAQRVRDAAGSPAAGEQALAELQAIFRRHLERAERFQAALAQPLPAGRTETAVFGGDCELTPGRAVLETGDDSAWLAFTAGEVRRKAPGMDYDRLLLEPGDGLVPRASQVGRLPATGNGAPLPSPFVAAAQTFFLCESHEKLTANPYFQNNLLYFLLSR